MATITSAGIGSGLDIESLITKLVAAERTPITQLQTRTDGLKTQLSVLGKLQSAVATMRDSASKLSQPATWQASLPSSSDSTAVTVSAGSATTPGKIAVSVSQLAASQTLSTKSFANSTTALGGGSITIELGSWNEDQTEFTTKTGTTAVTIDIAPGEDQLTQIRDKINAAKAGVVASVVTDASGSRLVIRSSETGLTNAFRISVNDSDGSPGDDEGLSALAYDPTVGVSSMALNLAAANAMAVLNGMPVESESNTMKDAIDGLNISLLKKTTGDVTLSVDQDKEGIKKAINEFVTNYNAVVTMIRDQTKYDQANKTAGALQGDSTVNGLQRQLRNLAGAGTTLSGSSSLTRLADLGLDPGSDGLLKVNSSKLDKALTNLDQVKSFFSGIDASDAGNNGLAVQFRALGDTILSTDGSLTNRQAGIQSRITANGKRADQLEDHVSLTEARLRARYTALDTQMGKLNGLSTYVTQQMALLTKSSS
ncbi:flagellar filament capping protein FliD [Pelomonas sp. SE-A7]|uniref:flagellar filament capping protein FliD n=1 Tax=Pelomonas sp. SE-A7 TaxID=3054953 RepID=UPI00259D101F|nr:flagellar filament capping protein FliD [Pelomonas sp. SE-A7]MDM4764505.1 flagellar filament capping protein FliD [Pelomonas sp. SE-A7]